jgi:hypothetical protein
MVEKFSVSDAPYLISYLPSFHTLLECLLVAPTDSEPAYFWYQNQVKTEVGYMISEALPDWKHKSTRVERACFLAGMELKLNLARPGPEADFARWFANLREEVQEWRRIVGGVEAPDFEQAVANLMDLKAGQEKRAVYIEKAVPSMDIGDKPIRKIGKVDSGIDF